MTDAARNAQEAPGRTMPTRTTDRRYVIATAFSSCPLSDQRIRPGDPITIYDGRWCRLDAVIDQDRQQNEARTFREQMAAFISRLPQREVKAS